jgi:transmembrane sensor
LTNSHYDIDELIGKWLAAEADATEQAIVKEWCAQSRDNQRYYEQLQTIFEKAAHANDTARYDADVAWKKVQARLHARKISWHQQPVFRVAASILLLSVIGFWTYQYTRTETVELVSAEGVVTDSLPDGTAVVLNRQTQLAVTYNAQQKKGRVRLTGEAGFSMKHEQGKQLIIEAEGTLVRHIGTVFNVKAYPQSNIIEVTVTEGEVQFYTQSSEGISIKAGGKGVYNKLANSFSLAQADTNVLAYQNRQFVFEERDLQTVIEQLNAIYQKKIKISEALKTCSVTVSFYNEEIETIAEILAETLNLRLRVADDEIMLEGEGCE